MSSVQLSIDFAAMVKKAWGFGAESEGQARRMAHQMMCNAKKMSASDPMPPPPPTKSAKEQAEEYCRSISDSSREFKENMRDYLPRFEAGTVRKEVNHFLTPGHYPPMELGEQHAWVVRYRATTECPYKGHTDWRLMAAQPDPFRLDLHHMSVEGAVQLVRLALDAAPLKKGTWRRRDMLIVTGRGNNSRDGIARIRPAIEELLRKRNHAFHYKNPGCICVPFY